MISNDVRTEKINFTCDTETKQYLRIWAAKESRTLSNLVEKIVTAAIEQDKENQNPKQS
ncbi:MAG: ribbon-helix-helix domain-containing protein [Dolichospermum sp.]